MQKSLLYKTLIIGLLAILIYIPLTMIQSTIWERMRYRDEAIRSITADSVSEQMVVGPVLVIPYIESWEEESLDAATQKTIRRQLSASRQHYVYPNDMQILGHIDTDQRYRGIHQVLVYSGQHSINGDFILPVLSSLIPKDKPKATVTTPETPYIAIGLSDTRGLQNFPKLKWAEQVLEFKQGSGLDAFQSGIHANLGSLQLTEVCYGQI